MVKETNSDTRNPIFSLGIKMKSVSISGGSLTSWVSQATSWRNTGPRMSFCSSQPSGICHVCVVPNAAGQTRIYRISTWETLCFFGDLPSCMSSFSALTLFSLPILSCTNRAISLILSYPSGEPPCSEAIVTWNTHMIAFGSCPNSTIAASNNEQFEARGMINLDERS